nr:phytosulfokine receptor 1-like isoform X3 [Ziziphus jujuba var. spinosa]
MDSYCFLVIIVVTGFFSIQADQALSSQNLPCNINDMKALQDFMTGLKTVIDGWSTNYSSDCCKWTGITCSFSSSLGLDNSTESAGRVVKLELPKKKLAENYFSGNLPPGLGNCASSLEKLSLNMNDLTGGIPEGIFRFQKLILLELKGNKFSGPLGKGISNLTNLVHLDISGNKFSGIIPDVFHSFVKLRFFVAHSNNFTGFIPSSLTNSYTLTVLNIRNNSLEGSVDLNCSAMVSLTSLDLGSNRLSGPIPDNLPSCERLNNINLARNRLRSLIPESFKNFHSLSYLSLSNSSIYNLSSSLRILQHCKNLTTLVLPGNFQNEELPADSTLHFRKLKILVIANCRLTGSIPVWLLHSSNLHFLDLSWNHLNGQIPFWVGNFSFLFFIDFSNNSLTGEIPKSITDLRSLIDSDISIEESSLDFPIFMKRNLDASGLPYNKLLSFPPTLDFSYNNLSGPIWPEFGNLRTLHVLNLKVNKISGPIPSNLSGMTSLETLDLSHNKLSGTIPASLVKLSFLSKFNVADNQLYGQIPSGGQFSTFPASSFQGNNLCGDHNSPCESNDQLPSLQPDESSRSNSIINSGFFIAMAIGFAFGLFSSIISCNKKILKSLLKLFCKKHLY